MGGSTRGRTEGRNKIKICIASTWKSLCGISTYSNYQTSELQKLNPDLFILAEDRTDSGPDDTQQSTLPYSECWSRYRGFDRVLDVIKQQKPDIIHWSHEFGLFCLTKKTMLEYLDLLEKINKLNIKQTIVYHSVPHVLGNPFFSEYFERSSSFFDKIIVHTDEQMFKLIEYKVPQSKLVHINHGVLLCPLYDKQEARKKLGIPQNKKVVMSMGFFGGLKGVDELIGIHAELIKTDPNILFYFVGGLHYATAIYGRDYMKQCFKNILNKGLKDKFIITGFVHEDLLPWYYAASDLAVLNYKPSGYLSASGCSAKLVASKRLIVTTDGTHRNDEIRNGKECIKIHYADMEGLTRTIQNVINHPDENIINNAYSYAQENQWATAAKKHMEIWNEIGNRI